MTGIYATTQQRPTLVPLWAIGVGVGATLVIGAVAGLYPAIRAARLALTEALARPEQRPVAGGSPDAGM